MNTIRQLLRSKGSQIYSISPNATVFAALQLLAEKNIGALLVLDNEQLVGILSERDYARKVALDGRSSREMLVHEIMTPCVISVNPDATIEECLAVMTEKHIRHLPVIEDGKLMGVISLGDVGKAVIAEQKFLIENLVNYISGK